MGFLLHDDLEQIDDLVEDSDNERIIIFVSDRMLSKLQNASSWMLDETFEVAPSPFLQLYTIHAV